MADSAPASRSRWLWIVLIVALAIVLLVWLLDPEGDADDIAAAPEAAATGFVVAPSEAAVPVTLPETPMTNAPAAPAE